MKGPKNGLLGAGSVNKWTATKTAPPGDIPEATQTQLVDRRANDFFRAGGREYETIHTLPPVANLCDALVQTVDGTYRPCRRQKEANGKPREQISFPQCKTIVIPVPRVW